MRPSIHLSPVESVRASSAEAFGFHGNLVEVDLREGPVLLTVHVDETEHARRTDARLGAITNRQLVTALWELPGGVELSTPDLPTWIDLRIFRRQLSTNGVTRWSEPLAHH